MNYGHENPTLADHLETPWHVELPPKTKSRRSRTLKKSQMEPTSTKSTARQGVALGWYVKPLRGEIQIKSATSKLALRVTMRG